MAKKGKTVEEEIPIKEAPVVIQETVAETPEQQAARRRQEEALIARKEVLERNGLKFEDHTSADGVEIVASCCGK
jgi:hypothetical protein